MCGISQCYLPGCNWHRFPVNCDAQVHVYSWVADTRMLLHVPPLKHGLLAQSRRGVVVDVVGAAVVVDVVGAAVVVVVAAAVVVVAAAGLVLLCVADEAVVVKGATVSLQ